MVCAIVGLTDGRASGTYPPAPPRLRSDITASIDPVAYNLGKAIYTGRAELSGGTSAGADQVAARTTLLTHVISQIPERARENLDPANLAHRLDQAGTDALLYYLRLRFRVTEANS